MLVGRISRTCRVSPATLAFSDLEPMSWKSCSGGGGELSDIHRDDVPTFEFRGSEKSVPFDVSPAICIWTVGKHRLMLR